MTNIDVFRAEGEEYLILATDTHHMAIDVKKINKEGNPNLGKNLFHKEIGYAYLASLYDYGVGDEITVMPELPLGTVVADAKGNMLKKMRDNEWQNLETGLNDRLIYPATIVRLGY